MNGLRSSQTKKPRRRRTQSDWLIALRQTRDARSLREILSTPTAASTMVRAEKTSTHSADENPSNFSDQSSYKEEQSSHEDAQISPDKYADIMYTGDTYIPFLAQEAASDSREHHETVEVSPQPATVSDTDQERTENDFAFRDEHSDLVLDTESTPAQLCAGHTMDVSDTRHGTESHDSGYIRTGSVLELLQDRRKMWENCQSLSALVSIVGSVRYTVEQYDYTLSVLRDVAPNREEIWPPYGRVQRRFKSIIDFCMPRSSLFHLPKKRLHPSIIPSVSSTMIVDDTDGTPQQTTPDRAATEIEHSPRQTEPVRIFFPTSWAQTDVSTSPTFYRLFSTKQSDQAQLESAQITRDRSSITDASRLLFVNKNGEHVACLPESVIAVSSEGDPPRFRTSINFVRGDNKFYFDAVVAATWGVGSAYKVTSTGEANLRSDTLCLHEKRIGKCLSKAERHSDGNLCPINSVIPGDMCTLLRASQGHQEDDHVPVIVHGFWRCEPGMPSITILWVRLIQTDDQTAPTSDGNCNIEVTEACIVSNIHLRRQGSLPITRTGATRSGTLADGTPFISYRFMLYCDDFQKSSHSSSAGSTGGCFFMPLAYPPEQRRSTSYVRLISLTPPGVSTNEVLRAIVDDIVKGRTHGVDAWSPDGTKVRIFLDLVGFIGDYPASASVVDVVGHVGNSPCTLCTFKRLLKSEADGSRYGYTTLVHANNSGFLRNAERHQSLRESDIPDKDANALGMKRKLRNRMNRSPLMELHQKLQKERHLVPHCSDVLPVVPAQLDPYRCNFVTPDRLLTGLSKDILNTLFLCLPTKEMQLQADIMMCAALRQNVLLRQKEIFNLRTKAVNSMTLSEVSCVLLVSGPILKIVTSRCSSESIAYESLKLLRKLHRLISLTYWWPQRHLDGESAIELVHNNKTRYFSELKSMSKEYVRAVDNCCVISEEGRTKLDKPNLHRLVELYEHSIPAFGHVREFMELIFESAHQPLKRSIAGSNNHDAHIFAMEQCVGNDWQGRIASLSREIKNADPVRQHQAKRGLRRVMLGREADLLHEERDQDFIRETDGILEKLLTPAVQRHFQRTDFVGNFATTKKIIWKAHGKVSPTVLRRTTSASCETISDIVALATTWINALFPADLNGNESKPNQVLNLFKGCQRVKVTDSGRRVGGLNGFDKISLNCVIQVYLSPERRKERILKFEDTQGSQPVFFVFLASLH